MSRRLLEELVFMAIIAVILVVMLWAAMDYPFTARLMPQVVAGTALLLLVIEFVQTVRRSRHKPATEHGEPLFGDKLKRTMPYLLWLAALYVAVSLIGLVISAALFCAAFGYFVGKLRWWAALLGSVLLVVFLIALGEGFNLDWPPGYFFSPFH
ncbi:tripartite tricarboxylate transporter TctB family protein [Halomonas sp. HP20-15]|uniref:tripartite tricarboxylate transporter TctB family protein n=1 Tax=Halomonas sp. HP20-15 TaxID=3085901 RepID=UPI00298266CC|nr:tripartite tricarboxylate transporter TctB family protein [Halomonas sp. HP20-15]MDW5377393.1 tripartite tricarboxylate transporter TctB family protein [Halomonas sp. HP20-15]